MKVRLASGIIELSDSRNRIPKVLEITESCLGLLYNKESVNYIYLQKSYNICNSTHNMETNANYGDMLHTVLYLIATRVEEMTSLSHQVARNNLIAKYFDKLLNCEPSKNHQGQEHQITSIQILSN